MSDGHEPESDRVLAINKMPKNQYELSPISFGMGFESVT